MKKRTKFPHPDNLQISVSEHYNKSNTKQMRPLLCSDGAISKRFTEMNTDNVTSKLTQFSFRSTDEFNNFVHPFRYLTARPNRCSHLLCFSLIIVFRDRNLKIYRMGEFCVTVNILRSLRENTADTTI